MFRKRRYEVIDDGAHAQHQAAVQNVLAGESPVDPRCDGRDGPPAQQVDQADDRVAATLGGDRERLAVVVTQQVRQVRAGRFAGRQARDGQGTQPGGFHRDHRLQQRPIRHVLAGPVVAGPQQIGHRRSSRYARNTVSFGPCRWMSKR